MSGVEKKPKSVLNIYLKRHEYGRVQDKRPFAISSVETTEQCVKWRYQLIKEISNEITQIQDPGLGELKIREKNDLINKLLREKSHWDKRIIELSGFEFAESIGIDCTAEKQKESKQKLTQSLENEAILAGTYEKMKKRQRFEQFREQQRQNGKDKEETEQKTTATIHNTAKSLGLGDEFKQERIIGVNGYYYFGAAKDLPGVRELYEQSKVQVDLDKKKRDLRGIVNAQYFGFLEEYNEQLLYEEQLIEQEMIAELAENEKSATKMDLGE